MQKFNVSDFPSFFCPVCEFMIETRKDSSYIMSTGCCENCATYFAEPRRKQWQEGWRPSRDELESYKSRLSHKQIRSR
jgi:hypothetical protein